MGEQKRVAIIQSNYIPWKGYFDIINMVDEFVLYDEMQYPRRDWRNRNKIKTQHGLKWITIPIDVKGKYYQKINEAKVKNHDWCENHFKSLYHNYAKATHFSEYKNWLELIYEKAQRIDHLSAINHLFLTEICNFLGVKTAISWSRDFNIEGERTEKLLSICLQSGATHYLSGPAAKDYLEVEKFKEKGIEVEWMDYSGYPEYPQLYDGFEHGVTILDLLFNVGDKATEYMKSFQ